MVGFLKRSHIFFLKTVPPQYQNDWLEKIETCSWVNHGRNTVKAKLGLRLSESFFSFLFFFLGVLKVGKTV